MIKIIGNQNALFVDLLKGAGVVTYEVFLPDMRMQFYEASGKIKDWAQPV